jgi:hypothetical protein
MPKGVAGILRRSTVRSAGENNVQKFSAILNFRMSATFTFSHAEVFLFGGGAGLTLIVESEDTTDEMRCAQYRAGENVGISRLFWSIGPS